MRYPNRPWYSPLGWMAHAPHSYAMVTFTIGGFIAFPIRYALSDYWERMSPGMGTSIQSKAIQYYRELEIMHRRQAIMNDAFVHRDFETHSIGAQLGAQAIKMGVTDYEFQYWHAHQKDAIRAEKLLSEIKELQEKVKTV